MLSSDPLDFYWLVILRDSVHLVPDYPGLPSQSDYATWNYRFSKPTLVLAVNVLNHYYKCYFSRRQRLSAQNRERRSTGVRRNIRFWLKLKCDVMFLKIDVKCCYVKFCNSLSKVRSRDQKRFITGIHEQVRRLQCSANFIIAGNQLQCSLLPCPLFVFMSTGRPKNLLLWQQALVHFLFPQKTTIFWGTLCVS